MKSFKEFMMNQEAAPPKWKASKDQIIATWKQLRPDTPIIMRPVPYNHEGSTYGEDGLRITGSPQFINSVLPRLKELLQFESPTTKLSLVYRETESPSKSLGGGSKTSYVFYVQAKERGNQQQEIKPKEPEF